MQDPPAQTCCESMPSPLPVHVSQSLWQTQLLTLYLFTVLEDMRYVGLAEGAQGVARLLSAVLIGRAIDRLPRRLLLNFAASSGIVVHALLLWLICSPPVQDAQSRLRLWLLVLSIYAVQQTLLQTLADVVFADSIASGGRVLAYTQRGAIVKGAQLAAPVVLLVLFGVLDAHNWTEKVLRPHRWSSVCCLDHSRRSFSLGWTIERLLVK